MNRLIKKTRLIKENKDRLTVRRHNLPLQKKKGDKGKDTQKFQQNTISYGR